MKDASRFRIAPRPGRSLTRIGATLFAVTMLGMGLPAQSQSEPVAADKYPQSEAKVVKQEDGSLLVDDRFVMKGEGTALKPYVISWDLLVSGMEEFDPRAKKTTLPGRLMMLNGKHVQIDGYVCFPLAIEQPKELLAMLNEWDGCCIGVPPTPYDAVEVRLAQPVMDDGRYAVTGSVQGVFKVEPYLVGEWLVGLYLMDDAKFMPKRTGGMGT